MKRITVLWLFLLSYSMIYAVPDIEFSPGGTAPGKWNYEGITGTSGTLSFLQQIDIDFIQGVQVDALFKQFVFLPTLNLSGYSTLVPGVGTGFVSSGGNVEIKDAANNLLFPGTMQSGNFYATFSTSTLFPEIAAEVTATYINHAWGSSYLNSISAGDSFDLNLTLQASVNFDQVIKNDGTAQNGFSGSMTAVIPEPTTMTCLLLGGFLLRKKSSL